jgi:hypothetical protein
VLNKLDLTGLPPAVERDEYGRISRVRLSAVGPVDGLPLLREALAETGSGEDGRRTYGICRSCGTAARGQPVLLAVQDVDRILDSDGSP